MEDHMSSFSEAEEALERDDPGREGVAMVGGRCVCRSSRKCVVVESGWGGERLSSRRGELRLSGW